MDPKMLALSLLLTPGLLTVVACDVEEEPPASREEMRDAVVEVAELGEGTGVQDDVIELTTSFTLGQGVQAAAEEIRDFVESQVPCSTVTVGSGQVSIDFGELGDACVYRGRSYAGVITVGIELPGEGAQVTHTYEGFTGGRVTMDGTATITWTGAERHIVGDWSLTSSERTVEVDSDRTQSFSRCEGVQAVCASVNGERHWSSPRGEWSLTIEDVHARSIDPVPEAGRYTVVDPAGHELEMSFSRVDEHTIQVDISGGRRDFTFEVTAAAGVSE
ncbi:MAG: hypothetical protein KC501_13705 [Myxococcales bacterium]|nr:hypothetical protein [Myxococcales bacterium]